MRTIEVFSYVYLNINDNKDNKILGGNENLCVYLLLNFSLKNTFFL